MVTTMTTGRRKGEDADEDEEQGKRRARSANALSYVSCISKDERATMRMRKAEVTYCEIGGTNKVYLASSVTLEHASKVKPKGQSCRVHPSTMRPPSPMLLISFQMKA